MQKLNLPAANLQLTDSQPPKVWDVLRRKYLVLTPEEWVRQHVLHYLIGRGYPAGLISSEQGLRWNQMDRRCDLLAHDRHGQPFLLVECKASSVMLTADTLRQAATYNQTLKAQYLAISNGLQHGIWRLDAATQQYQQQAAFPDFPA